MATPPSYCLLLLLFLSYRSRAHIAHTSSMSSVWVSEWFLYFSFLPLNMYIKIVYRDGVRVCVCVCVRACSKLNSSRSSSSFMLLFVVLALVSHEPEPQNTDICTHYPHTHTANNTNNDVYNFIEMVSSITNERASARTNKRKV